MCPASRTTKRYLRKARRIILRTLLVLPVSFLVYSILIEPAMLEVTRHTVSIQSLPAAFDGLKVVQLTDLHTDVLIRPEHVRKIVRQVNDMRPDLILLTGDYVSRTARNIDGAGEALAGLKARHGVYAVLGNHDYWTDWQRMTAALRKAGIEVLFDESREIKAGRDSIWLVGFDDEWEGSPDYDAAMRDVPGDAVSIGLAHNPDAVLSLKDKPVSLLLSGHTHGGLINLPITGPLFATTRLGPAYSAGMFNFGRSRLYISRGIGAGILSHIRFRSRPEISVFTLRRPC